MQLFCSDYRIGFRCVARGAIGRATGCVAKLEHAGGGMKSRFTRLAGGALLLACGLWGGRVGGRSCYGAAACWACGEEFCLGDCRVSLPGSACSSVIISKRRRDGAA